MLGVFGPIWTDLEITPPAPTMTEKESHRAYFELFEGKQVLRSRIVDGCPNMIWAIDVLSQMGKVVGQFTYHPKRDLLLWLSKGKK